MLDIKSQNSTQGGWRKSKENSGRGQNLEMVKIEKEKRRDNILYVVLVKKQIT